MFDFQMFASLLTISRDWSWRSLLIISHHPSDALFRLTLDKWFSITLFGQINPNNCTPRMEIWCWSAIDNWIFQFPSPNVFVLNNSPIIDVMAVGARSEKMRFVILQLSISNMSQQKTTNDCHLSQEHSTRPSFEWQGFDLSSRSFPLCKISWAHSGFISNAEVSSVVVIIEKSLSKCSQIKWLEPMNTVSLINVLNTWSLKMKKCTWLPDQKRNKMT